MTSPSKTLNPKLDSESSKNSGDETAAKVSLDSLPVITSDKIIVDNTESNQTQHSSGTKNPLDG